MELKFNINKYRAAIIKDLESALVRVGKNLVDDVRESMTAGSGRKYNVGGKSHQASAAGEPPSPITGRLRDSVMYTTNFGRKSRMGGAAWASDELPEIMSGSRTELVLVVGSGAPYALDLEKGVKKATSRRKKMQPRPFMRPALMRSREMIKAEFGIK